MFRRHSWYSIVLILFPLITSARLTAGRAEPQNRSAARRMHAPYQLAEQMARDSEDMKRCLSVDHHHDSKAFAARLDSRRVDLNRDGHADYLVYPGNACSGLGANNIPLYAYVWESGRYRMVLTDGGLDIRPAGNVTNGYLDIRIESHASGNDVDISIYKFQGTDYKLRTCLTAKYDDVRQRFTKTIRQRCDTWQN
jgi:hypothetical protein